MQSTPTISTEGASQSKATVDSCGQSRMSFSEPVHWNPLQIQSEAVQSPNWQVLAKDFEALGKPNILQTTLAALMSQVPGALFPAAALQRGRPLRKTWPRPGPAVAPRNVMSVKDDMKVFHSYFWSLHSPFGPKEYSFMLFNPLNVVVLSSPEQ